MAKVFYLPAEQIRKWTVFVERTWGRLWHLHLAGGCMQLFRDASDVSCGFALRPDLLDVSPCPMLVRHLLFHFMQVPHLRPQEVRGRPVLVE
jgi:hypothetical protein